VRWTLKAADESLVSRLVSEAKLDPLVARLLAVRGVRIDGMSPGRRPPAAGGPGDPGSGDGPAPAQDGQGGGEAG